jgi:hypothetical protein
LIIGDPLVGGESKSILRCKNRRKPRQLSFIIRALCNRLALTKVPPVLPRGLAGDLPESGAEMRLVCEAIAKGDLR